MARSRQFDPDDALDRAMRVFWRNGYAHTSMSMLVDATGVVRASLYSTFGNKAALFRRALDRYAGLRSAGIDPAGDPGVAMRTYLEGAIDADNAAYPPGCLLFGTAGEYHALEADLRAEIDAHLGRVERFFRMCIARIAPADRVDQLTHVVVGANAAVFTLARIGAPAEQLRDIIDAAIGAVDAARESSAGA